MPRTFPPHIVLLRGKADLWRLAFASGPQEPLADFFALQSDSLADGARLKYPQAQACIGKIWQSRNIPQSLQAKRYYCHTASGIISEEALVIIADNSFLGLHRKQARLIASDIYAHHAFSILAKRAPLFGEIAHFATEYFIGYTEVETMLARAAELLECRALSLWLYNKHTGVYTLYGTHNISPCLYSRDWFRASENSVINLLCKVEGDKEAVVRFFPNPKKSANPRVAKQFANGYLCQLRSQASMSLLGILTVYEPQEVAFVNTEDHISLVARTIREHLLQIRARNRYLGNTIVSSFLQEAGRSATTSACNLLCEHLKKDLSIGACSVFLAKDREAKSVELVSTTDTLDAEFVGRGPEHWWRTTSYQRGQGLTGGIIASGMPEIVYDLCAREKDNSHIYDEKISSERKGWIGVPIFCPGQTKKAIGVLRAVNKLITRENGQEPWHFQGSDVETMSNLAIAIGYIWHNELLQQQSERSLRQAERERDLKSQFLVALGHEMVEPLHGLTNLLELLGDRDIPISTTKRFPYLLEGARAVFAQMEMTIANIMALDDPGRMCPERTHLVKQIVHRVVDLFRIQAKEDKAVDLYFAEEMWQMPQLFVDPRVGRQILFALVHNACKYCEVGTTIHLDCKVSPSGDRVVLSVADQGLLIPQGWEETIFLRGERAPNVREQLLPGSGLGLTIARQLALALGGDVTVQRTANPVVIAVEFPIAKEP